VRGEQSLRQAGGDPPCAQGFADPAPLLGLGKRDARMRPCRSGFDLNQGLYLFEVDERTQRVVCLAEGESASRLVLGVFEGTKYQCVAQDTLLLGFAELSQPAPGAAQAR
jgi:hypothetical protein